MKFLFLTPNFSNYNMSQYQQSTLKYLQKNHEVIIWGPGHSNFDFNKTFEKVLEDNKITETDVLCVGHGWLSDLPLKNEFQVDGNPYNWIKDNHKLDLNSLEYIAKYDFKIFKGKKIFFLNKEYQSLEAKLNFAEKNKFDLVLTLNPNYRKYMINQNLNIKFWPIAVDHKIFNNINLDKIKKEYDIFFSGLIQNFNFNNKSLSLRTQIMKELFFSIDRVKLFKKKKYSKTKIFWNSFTARRKYDIMLKCLGKYKFLNEEKYIQKLQSSRVSISTLSPSDIIGPRFFESMMLGTVILCENDSKYDEVFDRKKHVVTFDKNLENFHEKLNFSISDSKEVEKIKLNAYNHTLKNHTYQKRIEDLLSWINII